MKLGNRKKNRDQYLLDVKVQTQGRTRQRVRIGVAILLTLGALTLTGYGLYRLAAFAVARLVFENPRFAIMRVDVEDSGVLSAQRVVQFAGVRVGENLFSLDLNQVRRNLEMIPLIKRVEVHRVVPDRLVIRVDERLVMARMRVPTRELEDAVFFVDRAGVVMKPLKLGDGRAS